MEHINLQSDDDAFSEVKGTARPENAAGVEPSSSDTPSAAPTAEPEATPSPPPASGTPLHSSKLFSSQALTDSPAQSSRAPGSLSKLVNPNCRRAARGEQCALAHSQASYSKCQQIADEAKRRVPA